VTFYDVYEFVVNFESYVMKLMIAILKLFKMCACFGTLNLMLEVCSMCEIRCHSGKD